MSHAKSSPRLDCYTPISPSDLRALEDSAPDKAATIISSRVKIIDLQAKLTYAECGMLAEYLDAHDLYRYVENPSTGKLCTSQNEWLSCMAPFGRSTWFGAKKTWKELSDIPADDRVRMSRANLLVMQKLSTAIRADRQTIRAAKEMNEGDFREKIESQHPLEHIEAKIMIRLFPERSQAKVIEEAMALAIQLGAHNREEAIEMMAAEFMESHDGEGTA